MGNVSVGAGYEKPCWFKDCDNSPTKLCSFCREGENDSEREVTTYVCREHHNYHWNNEHQRLPGTPEKKPNINSGQSIL